MRLVMKVGWVFFEIFHYRKMNMKARHVLRYCQELREIRKFIASVSKLCKLIVTFQPNTSNYMEQIPSWYVSKCQCNHAASHLLYNPSSLTLSRQREMSQYPELMNPVHILISCLFKIYFNFSLSYIYIYIYIYTPNILFIQIFFQLNVFLQICHFSRDSSKKM
jgi:hypothetical protein